MKMLNTVNCPRIDRPIKVLQFGNGNFLRGFIDWQIQQLNEHTSFNADVIAAERGTNPKTGSINKQDGLYHTVINGIDEHGNQIEEIQLIDCLRSEIDMSTSYEELMSLAKLPTLEWVFSNTTEAGIAFCATDQLKDFPPSSFPAKLTQFLYERYNHFNGDLSAGLTILPCELIDDNAETLKSIILKYIRLWQLPEQFESWVHHANLFCSTLVDRIVPGFPAQHKGVLWEKIGYQDHFMVAAEYFYLFVIEGPESIKKRLYLDQLPLNIIVTDNIKPYKEQKVAILNGAHTALMPIAYLCGKNTVKEALDSPLLERYLNLLLEEEVIPSLSLPKKQLDAFSRDVIRRFKNPFIEHQWLSIALNSMTKFKTRNLPALLDYVDKNDTAPHLLAFSLATLIVFYRGQRNGDCYQLNDDPEWLEFYVKEWRSFDANTQTIGELVSAVLNQESHWGINLNNCPQLSAMVTEYCQQILNIGVEAALQNLVDWYSED